MPKHSIILRREGMEGFQSNQSIGTDARNAMSSIPGVKNPEIINKSEELVVISYDWVGEGKFLKTDEHLLKYGLARSEVKTA